MFRSLVLSSLLLVGLSGCATFFEAQCDGLADRDEQLACFDDAYDSLTDEVDSVSTAAVTDEAARPDTGDDERPESGDDVERPEGDREHNRGDRAREARRDLDVLRVRYRNRIEAGRGADDRRESLREGLAVGHGVVDGVLGRGHRRRSDTSRGER